VNFDENNRLIPPSQWSEQIGRAVASIDAEELIDDKGKFKGYVKRIRFHSKNDALQKLMTHLGLLEKINRPLPCR
jgi:hypothetical protein